MYVWLGIGEYEYQGIIPPDVEWIYDPELVDANTLTGKPRHASLSSREGRSLGHKHNHKRKICKRNPLCITVRNSE